MLSAKKNWPRMNKKLLATQKCTKACIPEEAFIEPRFVT